MSYIGNEPIVSATRTITEIVATAGQTVFVANGGYTVGFIDVFVNGAQLQTNDFTATNGTSVTLGTGATIGDDIRLVAWGTFSTATQVLSVSGTAPVVSSGGQNPAISMPAATAAANGYMTSTYASKLDGIAAGATNTTIVAGTGISVSGSTGAVTITNTATSSYAGGRGQVFTASGTFTVPSGITAVKVTVLGGGGNGGGASGGGQVGGGGGGGGLSIGYATGLTPGGTITVTVGGAGGTSSFSTYASATGGGTGGSGTNAGGGAGGVGSLGAINANGFGGSNGSGGGCNGLPWYSGAGGGVVPTIQFGTVGGSIGQGGNSNIAGATGTGYGNGGSGAVSSYVGSAAGGAGRPGIVIVEW